jgi:PPM family protein phosphatase
MCFWWKRKRSVRKKKSGKCIDISSIQASNKVAEELINSKKKKDKPIEVAAYTTDNLKLVPSNCQHIGDRQRQEDSFAFSDLGDGVFVKNYGVLAVVADGMGGLAKGDQASYVAVNMFLEEYKRRSDEDSLDQFLLRTALRSNCAVYDLAYDGEVEHELGTTLVAVAIQHGKMHWISVGDSRIYHYKNKILQQLNKEHIYANLLKIDVEKGLITEEEANKNPERSYLTSFLGMPDLNEVDSSLEPVTLQPGEIVLLCSDGLTNTLSDQEITDIISRCNGNIAEELTQKALKKNRRHQDNITVLAISCQPVVRGNNDCPSTKRMED